jgi:hypothetical protein
VTPQPDVQLVVMHVSVPVQSSAQPPPGQSSSQLAASTQFMLHDPPGQENEQLAPARHSKAQPAPVGPSQVS